MPRPDETGSGMGGRDGKGGGRGGGIAAAQLVVNKGADALLIGHVGT